MAIYLKSIPIKRSLLYVLIPFIVYAGASVVWSTSRPHTVAALISLFSYIALFLVCCSRIWNEREKKFVKNMLIILSVYYAMTLIGEQISSTIRRATISFGMMESSSDENMLAANIGIGLLFALEQAITSKKNLARYVFLMAVFTIFLGILSTGSRGPLIAVLIAVLMYIRSCNKSRIIKRGMLGAMLICGALLIFYSFGSNSFISDSIISRYTSAKELVGGAGRISIWSRFSEIYLNWPMYFFIGFGFGQTSSLYSAYYSTNWVPATHNDIFFIIGSVGIIGLFLVFYIIRYVWKQAKKNKNDIGKACIILVLVTGLTLNMFISYGWWNAMIFAYIGIGNNVISSEEKSECLGKYCL
jgi:O-antigen ligase